MHRPSAQLSDYASLSPALPWRPACQWSKPAPGNSSDAWSG